jgi:hypothetical protein
MGERCCAVSYLFFAIKYRSCKFIAAMVTYTTTIHKFEKNGDKTGWTYIEIPADIAAQLKPGNKKSFRVKGKLDKFKIAGVALLPAGNGTFMMALNAIMRKGIGKKHGAMLQVQLTEDKAPFQFNQDFIECLSDEPIANHFFETLTPSHQRYFSKWIDEAKTETTRTKRMAQAVSALAQKLGYSEMIRSQQKKNQL